MAGNTGNTGPTAVTFAAYAEDAEALDHVYYLAESIREFGGSLRASPILMLVPDDIKAEVAFLQNRFSVLDVTVVSSKTPEDAGFFYFSGKTFAAGLVEREVAGDTDILVWMDEDTIVLREPLEFELDPGVSFAFRPVMHNRSGTLHGATPNPFWKRIYDVLEIAPEKLFPMTTPADRQVINAYFNAGLMAVRPEKGVLRKWGEDFKKLYRDPELAASCREDVEKRIFLHQTALVGAVLNTLKRHELMELSDRYNYPLFFEQMFDATAEFCSLDDIVTLRYDVYFRNPDPQWSRKLKGTQKHIAWLKARLGPPIET